MFDDLRPGFLWAAASMYLIQRQQGGIKWRSLTQVWGAFKRGSLDFFFGRFWPLFLGLFSPAIICVDSCLPPGVRAGAEAASKSVIFCYARGVRQCVAM